ncbi:fish-egg lectin-like isoform X2 [Hyla sarda]|uniref:fish-egg lectin-like isoform X2 n=1 Tax=Hyla sarda TaxID=327740 RepID=UPI0024C401FC|nr:fish-egg lectin-like isoform X2 [Hyla sarda]
MRRSVIDWIGVKLWMLYIWTFLRCLILCHIKGLQCSKIPGKLKQIDAGAGQIYGVNKDDNIFKLMGQQWKQVPGKLDHVTVGEAGIWGTNKANNIFKLQDNKWKQVSGRLKQVDAGGNKFLSGVNSGNSVFCLNQDKTVSRSTSFSYTKLDGSLKYYSCGLNGCWGITPTNDIMYRYDVKPTECRGSHWKKVNGKLVMVEVGSDGSVYGVNSEGTAFKREGISAKMPTGNSWSRLNVPGTFRHVSTDGGVVWLLNQNGDIQKCIV